jgi:hypothetical protein
MTYLVTNPNLEGDQVGTSLVTIHLQLNFEHPSMIRIWSNE